MLTRRKLVASGLAGVASVGLARQGTWATLQSDGTPAATPTEVGRVLIGTGSPIVNGSIDRVSIAHQAIIEGSEIGDFTFFGFKSRTRNSVIGEGAMFIHGTTVEGVTIPPNVIAPVGVQILTVVFQATVESNVTVRQGALIVGAFTVR